MRTAWIEEEKKRLAAAAEPSKHLEAPWLQFDCRTACTSSSHFAATLKAAIAESAHKAAEAGRTLPLIRNRDHNSYVKVSKARHRLTLLDGLSAITAAALPICAATLSTLK